MTIKFKVDENLPVEVKDLLQREGHDALLVIDQQLGGSTDKEISKICQEENGDNLCRCQVAFVARDGETRPIRRGSLVYIWGL